MVGMETPLCTTVFVKAERSKLSLKYMPHLSLDVHAGINKHSVLCLPVHSMRKTQQRRALLIVK